MGARVGGRGTRCNRLEDHANHLNLNWSSGIIKKPSQETTPRVFKPRVGGRGTRCNRMEDHANHLNLDVFAYTAPFVHDGIKR